MTRISWLLVACLAVACSATGRGRYPAMDRGPDQPGPAPDHGVAGDTTPFGQEAGPAPDTGPGPGCEPQCTAQASFLCVTSASSSFCVECTANAHCAANPGAPGATCNNEICECASDADCVGKQMGSRCHANNKVCSCLTDADCSGGLRCIGAFYGTKVCKAPCTGDADCAANMFEIVCDPQSGCQECVDNSDCGSASLGNECLGGLCSCEGDADCAGNVNGKKCLESELCGCETDFDCPSGTACTGQYVGNKLCK